MNAIDWQKLLSFKGDPRLEVLPLGQFIYGDELRKRFPNGRIIVCDAYVQDIEKTGTPIEGGFQDGQLINIDHHANDPRMKRNISSTPLAIEFVAKFGTAGPDDVVIINHLDCDSILSAAIVLGLLSPDKMFGDAAIAADHTGDPSDIADLLQSLDRLRNFSLSINSLARMMMGQPLAAEAEQRRAIRAKERQLAEQMVKGGQFHFLPSGVAWAESPVHIDATFFPVLLPDAKIIMVASPMPDHKPGKRMSIRRGLAAPEGLTLHNLGIERFDPKFGGRWNAGSNNRGQGSMVSSEIYAHNLDDQLARKLTEFQVAAA